MQSLRPVAGDRHGDVLLDPRSLRQLIPPRLSGARPADFILSPPSSMKSYICPSCDIRQQDVLVEEHYLLCNPDDGWYNHRCPSCGHVLDDRLLEETGFLPK